MAMNLGSDLAYAVRQLRRSPGFSITAVLTLALGIGAATAMYSVVQQILLAPLPYSEPDRIVALEMRHDATGGAVGGASGGMNTRIAGGDYQDVLALGAFENVAYYDGGEMGVQLRDHAVFTGVAATSARFPAVLGVAPVAGTVFRESNATHEALVSAGFAQNQFGGVAAAVGRMLSVEGAPYEVVGVMPAGFSFPPHTEVWVGAPATPENLRHDANNYHALARLKRRTGLSQAEAQLGALSARWARSFPASHAHATLLPVPLKQALTGSVRGSLLLLMAAVTLVLLIVCVNLAHLQLARWSARAREMAVRSALGASRAGVVRPVAMEAAVLSMLGAGLGILLSVPVTAAVVRVAARQLPRGIVIHPSAGVLLFACAASLVTALVSAILPAWHASRLDPVQALKTGGRTEGTDRRSFSGSGRWRNLLVASEVALTFTLAVASGLMIHTMLYLHRVDLGFATSNRLVMYAHAPAREMAEYRKRTEELAQLTESLRDVPGVTRAAEVVGLPAGQYGSNGHYAVVSKGQAMEQGGLPEADFSLTGPGYFHTMDVPLLRGRDFTAADAFDGAPVAIISAALAKASFGGGDPMGQQIQCGWDEQSMQPMTIVGIAGDVRQQSPAERAGAVLYMPLRQHPMVANEVQIVLRTSGQPETLIETVGQRTNRFDPSIATQFTTVDTVIADATTAPRLRSELLSSFAGIGLVLAVIGIYGVMSYSVVQRRSEVGIRMALGALPSSILRLMIGQATRTALLGLAAGVVLSLLLVQTMRSMVVGLSVFDPMTYMAAIALLLTSVVCAAAVPARRAAAIEPMQALRSE